MLEHSHSESFFLAVRLKFCPRSSLPGPLSCSAIITLSRMAWNSSMSPRFRGRTLGQERSAVKCLICKRLSPPYFLSGLSFALSYACVEYPRSFTSVRAHLFKLFSRGSIFSPTGISSRSTMDMNAAF